MNEITLQIAESPNASKKDFLATLEPIPSTSTLDEEDLPFEITIDSYSREPWSCLRSPIDSAGLWKTVWFKSIDGKARLPPFLKFLKDRKKNAFGKFESPHPDENTGDFTTAIFLVPFEQPSIPSGVGADADADADGNVSKDFMFMKYCLDEKKMRTASHKATSSATSRGKVKNQKIQSQSQNQNQNQSVGRPRQHRPTLTNQEPIQPKSSGLLGNLLGAQQRTNQHLDSVPRRREKQTDITENSGGSGRSNGPFTSGQIINQFRDKIEKQLNEFNSSDKTEMKVSISLAEMTRMVDSMEEKSKITMDVMKYIVYEQVEEVNEEWIAAKEQGEFMDEAVVAVYKSGYAPPEVLEDLNKGELPDEVKQQQRAMREAMEKEEKKKLRMIHEQNKKKLGHEEVSALNTAKRDRRSIEEIQKDMVGGDKRSRTC